MKHRARLLIVIAFAGVACMSTAAAAETSRQVGAVRFGTTATTTDVVTTSPANSGSLNGTGVSSISGAPGGPSSTLTGSGSLAGPSPDPDPSNDSGYIWKDLGQDGNYECSNGVAVNVSTTYPLGSSTAVSPAVWQLYDPTGKAVGSPQYVCPATGGDGGSATPTAPPLPPSPAEAVAETPLPRPTFDWNPNGLGLTGLASWFWVGNISGPVTAVSSVRGYTVVTTAHPVAYHWYFGDGSSAEANSPGSALDPSVTHIYQAKGVYTLELIVAWQGEYTFSGDGVPLQTVQLGTVDGPTATTPYAVQEIRSVLVTPTS